MPKEKISLSDQESMIKTDVTSVLRPRWNLRDGQFTTDRNIINLVMPGSADKAKPLWISNEPKVFFDTARALVSINQPRFRLPIPIEYEPGQKKAMNKTERLCIGIFRLLDNRVAEMGGTSWLSDLAYWLLLGWYSVFAIVRRGEDGGPEFLADIWDPLTVYPEWDANGLSKVARVYTVDKVTAESMAAEYQSRGLKFEYEGPSTGDVCEVVNYWKKVKGQVYNAILLNGHIVKPMTLQRSLDHIPVFVGAVGSPDRVTSGWESRKGESIIAASRQMYDYMNQIISLRVEITRETAYPNMVTKTRTGQAAVKGEDVRGDGTVIPLKLEESIELLKHAATPQDADILAQYIGQQIQKASIPSSTYGTIVQDVSGFALSQYMAALKYKLGPYLNAMQFVAGRVMTDLLYQYRTGKYGKLTLSTENPHDLKRGMTYIEEYTTKDVPERIFVEVTIPITSQFDKTQTIMNAVQALNSKPQLLSRETLWETDMEVDDAEQEKTRIAEDQLANDPFIHQIEILERLWIRVQTYEAMDPPMTVEAMALRKYIAMLEMQVGIQRGGANPAGSQPAAPGIPPTQMPPEAGMNNPDMARAMTGTPPPSPNRPSQTGQVNEGRKGILLSPNGQWLM